MRNEIKNPLQSALHKWIEFLLCTLQNMKTHTFPGCESRSYLSTEITETTSANTLKTGWNFKFSWYIFKYYSHHAYFPSWLFALFCRNVKKKHIHHQLRTMLFSDSGIQEKLTEMAILELFWNFSSFFCMHFTSFKCLLSSFVISLIDIEWKWASIQGFKSKILRINFFKYILFTF